MITERGRCDRALAYGEYFRKPENHGKSPQDFDHSPEAAEVEKRKRKEEAK